MKILIVAATRQEIEPLLLEGGEMLMVNEDFKTDDIVLSQSPLITPCSILITGVGMVATAFALGQHLALQQYDLAINLGICGSFDRSIEPGEVVEIITDTLAEFGAEDDESFLPIEQLGFGEGIFNSALSVAGIIDAEQAGLPLKKVTGITVNTVHGNELRIGKTIERLNPQVESMEGAAFFYACRKSGLACIQIRAVSNYVEKRNRDNWQIGLAVKNLNIFVGKLLKQLAKLP